jgi:hypothetical protein
LETDRWLVVDGLLSRPTFWQRFLGTLRPKLRWILIISIWGAGRRRAAASIDRARHLLGALAMAVTFGVGRLFGAVAG